MTRRRQTVPAPDPVELLAALDPVDGASVAPTDEHEPAKALLVQLVSGRAAPIAPPRPRRFVRRRVVVGAAALTAAAVGAAWIVTRPATNPLEAACYAQPAPQGEVAGVAPGGSGPLEACAEVWRTGAFAGRGPVPPLVGCVADSGAAAVFPSDSPEICDRLGLDRLGGAPPSDGAITAVRDRLTEAFLALGCVAPDDAAARVRVELDRAGLGDWRVDNPGAYSASRPCASLSFDAARRTVTLVPSPSRPPSPSSTGGTTP